MERKTAAKVPLGRLFPGSLKSPDMLTPWVNPVTAGKKMANRTQNPTELSGRSQFARNVADSHLGTPPMKKDANASPKRVMTTN